jgi:RIO kinase 1
MVMHLTLSHFSLGTESIMLRASPRLKDASIPLNDLTPLYSELILAVRTLFHKCKLVHADLSEYNIIYHQSHLYIIDVSQSVEHDHPHAFDFLRSDLKNVGDFFGREGVKTLGLKRAFDFVTRDKLIDDEHADEAKILEELLALEVDEKEADTNDEEVFRKSYIPRRLNDLYNPERDAALVKKGDGDKLIYADTIGLVEPKTAPVDKDKKVVKVKFDDDLQDEDGESENDTEESDSEEDKPFEERRPRGHRHEDRDAKKVRCLSSLSLLRQRSSQERKKAVKEEAREKRKNKMPKAEKKRRIKTTSRG